MPFDSREKYLETARRMTTEKRLRHSLGVEKMAVSLAKRFGEDEQKASAAALLHDIAKKTKDYTALAEKYNIESDEVEREMPDLLHGPIAAAIMEHELGITDEDILNAVRYHTTGRPGMSRLEKIIYMADLVEENRAFEGVEALREAVQTDLDRGTRLGMAHVLIYLAATGSLICEKSVRAYNDMIKKEDESEGVR